MKSQTGGVVSNPSRAWSLLTATLIVVASVQDVAAASPGSRSTGTEVSKQLRRTPPEIPAQRLRVTGPALVRVDSGVSGEAIVHIEDRGTGGHLDIGYDGQGFSGSPVINATGPGRYRVTLQVPDDLAAGLYRGTFTARICQEAPCQTPVAGTTIRKSIRVHARWVNRGEWETFQRDAAHRGHVPVVVNPAHITPAWQLVPDEFALADVTASATTGRGVALISQVDEEQGRVIIALRESDGRELWRRSQWMTPPAVHDGRAYFVASSGGDGVLLSLNANDGMPLFQTSYDGDVYGEVTPVVDDGIVHMGISHPFGPVSAFDADDGLPRWVASISGGVGAMPAVRDGTSYVYDGSALRILDASDGAELATIPDPYEDDGDHYSANGAPMLGTPDHVIVLGGTDSTIGRPLVNFSPSAGMARWRSVNRYHTVPATADGVVYVASNTPRALDAIDEATGQVLWSWTPPSESGSPFVYNVVVTDNLVFASTRARLYAIDLSSRSEVWSAPTPGWISISGGGTLYVRRNINSGFSIETRAFRLH
jgi:outer membrane protein assembly factor BamB